MKEHKMFIFFLLKIKAKKLTIKKINIESVIPNTEFSIMYGENIKKHAPTMAISILKNQETLEMFKQNAKEHTKRFSLDNILPIYEDIYKSCYKKQDL